MPENFHARFPVSEKSLFRSLKCMGSAFGRKSVPAAREKKRKWRQIIIQTLVEGLENSQ